MPAYPCNPGPASWSGPRAGAFRPYGRIAAHPRNGRLADVAWESKDTLAARLFVGFSVGAEPRYDLDDLIAIVRAARERQAPDDPSATFLAQRGLYKYKGTGRVVEEDGGQVIVIDTQGLPPAEFERQMVGLAEEIASRLEQEMVVVELQRSGLVEKTIGVVP